MSAPSQLQPALTHGARMTADEFTAVPNDMAGYAELLEGTVHLAGGASIPHQDLHLRLVLLLTKMHLHERGTLLYAPLSVKLDDHNVVEPDLLWLSEDSSVVIETARLVGAPDLVIEIVSRSSGTTDKITKFALYEAAGVREYWLADPNTSTLDVFVLRNGRYERLGSFSEGSEFSSPTLAASVSLTGVFG